MTPNTETGIRRAGAGFFSCERRSRGPCDTCVGLMVADTPGTHTGSIV